MKREGCYLLIIVSESGTNCWFSEDRWQWLSYYRNVLGCPLSEVYLIQKEFWKPDLFLVSGVTENWSFLLGSLKWARLKYWSADWKLGSWILLLLHIFKHHLCSDEKPNWARCYYYLLRFPMFKEEIQFKQNGRGVVSVFATWDRSFCHLIGEWAWLSTYN